MAVDIDDDDSLFKNIDVDQIVEDYCTPKPSISKLPPITPTADKDNFARQGDDVLPPELCLDCVHGYMVFCSDILIFHKLSMFICQIDMPNPKTGCS